jgi:hypothetical protein
VRPSTLAIAGTRDAAQRSERIDDFAWFPAKGESREGCKEVEEIPGEEGVTG